MARGPSAKIVVEAGEALKAELYVALAVERLTLKEWFTREAKRFIARAGQPELPLPEQAEGKRRTVQRIRPRRQ